MWNKTVRCVGLHYICKSCSGFRSIHKIVPRNCLKFFQFLFRNSLIAYWITARISSLSINYWGCVATASTVVPGAGWLDSTLQLTVWIHNNVSGTFKPRINVLPCVWFSAWERVDDHSHPILPDVLQFVLRISVTRHCAVPENIHMPPMEGFLFCNHCPRREFWFSFILCSKNLDF